MHNSEFRIHKRDGEQGSGHYGVIMHTHKRISIGVLTAVAGMFALHTVAIAGQNAAPR